MLRIAKVRRGGEAYYFQTVRAVTDEPVGLVEADPYWLGSGARHLGLTGSPSLKDVRAILRGVRPGTGEMLADRRQGTVSVTAFDVVFSVPKSVSIVHGLAGPEAVERIAAAHRRAVEETVGYLEREVLRARRYVGSSSFDIGVRGAIAVAFVHRVSRADDPHLHSHVLVANLAEGDDGRFAALDARRLYRQQRSVRALFESHSRAELTAIGVELGPVRGDFADVASIPRTMVREFSRQGGAIAQAMAAEGPSGPATVALVAAAIRPPKSRSRPYEELQAEWRERGYGVGLSAGRVAQAAGDGKALQQAGRDPSAAGLFEAAASGFDGTFSCEDLVVARCVSRPEGATIERVLRDVAAALSKSGPATKEGRYVAPLRRAEVERAAARLSELARGLRVGRIAYEPGERAEGLFALGRLVEEKTGKDARVVALSPGRAAARRLVEETGLEAAPVSRAPTAIGGLGPGDSVVLADCGAMSQEELTRALRACELSGAEVVLFGNRASIARSLFLEGLSGRAVDLATGARRKERSPTPNRDHPRRPRLPAIGRSQCEEGEVARELETARSRRREPSGLGRSF